MIQPEINQYFSPGAIADFIIENDKDNKFVSEKLNKYEFINALSRLDSINHIITFRNEEKLVGAFGWFFIKEENKHLVGKRIWKLPEDLLDGDILYLAFIMTIEKCDILAVKKIFEDSGVRKVIKKIRGFSKNGWYEHGVRDY